MKKFTHPKKNTSLIISKNGATNYNFFYNNTNFIATPFDIRESLEIISNDANEPIETKLIILINEFRYTTKIMWSNFI